MHTLIKLSALTAALLGLGACSVTPKRDTYNEITAQLNDAIGQAKPGAGAPADPVAAALLPPIAQLAEQLPKARAALDERFNVAFNNVPAQQFFNSIALGTRYNILVHPDVTGTISANLKDVTMFEALEAVREMYGYDYRVDGTRIAIRPLTMQTRMFQVNYLTASRRGSSNLRVSSTSVSDSANNSNGNSNSNSSGSNNNNNNGGNNGNSNDPNASGSNQQQDASNVTTRSDSDFWAELKLSLAAIVGNGKDGRSVVVSPQSGVIVIRAMPDDLRNVDQYLKATQLAVGRQVILEAKILEVELSSSSQTGINWAAFGARMSAGMVAPGTSLAPFGLNNAQPPALSTYGRAGITSSTGYTLGAAGEAAGALFGLAFQTSNFAALISFLESQGTVHVLSSPRIATLNNQKAVLKIGTDEFFVTGVSTTTSTSTSGSGTISPNVTLQPFFSGVVLDVTPQIDDHGNVILHVHPSVSQVSTVNKAISLGTAGSLNLPLAASSTSEMDSVVRGQDGRVVALGGLMRQSASSERSQVPGAGAIPGLGALFRNTGEASQKRELVVLIKPTIIEAANDWNQDLLDTRQRVQRFDPRLSERK
ncbi:MAG: pilus (MSHA type) biogenesis protein MshL [Pseudomonadota bacterium]